MAVRRALDQQMTLCLTCPQAALKALAGFSVCLAFPMQAKQLRSATGEGGSGRVPVVRDGVYFSRQEDGTWLSQWAKGRVHLQIGDSCFYAKHLII